jgi:hypothetical protein
MALTRRLRSLERTMATGVGSYRPTPRTPRSTTHVVVVLRRVEDQRARPEQTLQSLTVISPPEPPHVPQPPEPSQAVHGSVAYISISP